MHHAVLGVGGIGGLLAGALARSDGEVVLLLRPPTLSRFDGKLRLESVVLGGFEVELEAVSGLDRPVDALWVTTKATQREAAWSLAPPQRVAQSPVIPLLNGIDHLALLRTRYANVVAAAIRVGSERVSPWLIRQSSPFLRVEIAGAEPFAPDRSWPSARRTRPNPRSARMSPNSYALHHASDTSRRPAATILLALVRAVFLLLTGQVRFPRAEVGRTLTMEDGDQFTVFRHAQVRGQSDPAAQFVVRFTPAHMSVRQNIHFSLLPMIPLLGMYGFREKRWCVNKDTGMCQGVYAWQTRADAEAYSHSVALRFMTSRSQPGSVSFRVIDGSFGPVRPS